MNQTPTTQIIENVGYAYLIFPTILALCPLGILALLLFRKRMPEVRFLAAIAILSVLNLGLICFAAFGTVEVVSTYSSGGDDDAGE